MRRAILVLALATMTLTSTSCGSKKKIAELEAKNKEIQDLLNSATVKLNTCLTERDLLNRQVDDLRKDKSDLMNTRDNLTTLSSKGAQNLEKSLESLKEKDLKITRLQDALTRKDSVTLALVTSIKRAVGVNDPDIDVSVEKGLTLLTIRHYQASLLAELTVGKIQVLMQQTADTVQVLMR